MTNDAINHTNLERWFADGKRFLFSRNEPGHGVRLYVQNITGGKPQAITPEGVDAAAFAISPDGQLVAESGPDQKGYLYPVTEAKPSPIPGFSPGEEPINWSEDGHSLFIYMEGETPAKVNRLNVTTQKIPWKTVVPSIPPGSNTLVPFC